MFSFIYINYMVFISTCDRMSATEGDLLVNLDEIHAKYKTEISNQVYG